MTTMTGRMPSSFPESPPEGGAGQDDLFQDLVVSNPRKTRGWFGVRESVVAHALLISALVLVPILWPERMPELDYVKVLIYNPPPPPPPPLPKGTAMVQRPKPAEPVTPAPHPEKPQLTTPQIPTTPQPLQPEARPPESEQAGSPTGSDIGVPEGMEEGVEGGVVGGVPGGVIGGVIGGTGDTIEYNPDTPLKIIRQSRPAYPQDAFVKKIEGTVVVEILVDTTGHVIRTRILTSIPSLDAAAIACVRQWVFAPATKNGHPVASIARAPVSFRIF